MKTLRTVLLTILAVLIIGKTVAVAQHASRDMGDSPGMHERGTGGFIGRSMDDSTLDVVASEIGLTPALLQDALATGATAEELIQEAGLTVDDVVQAVLAERQAAVDAAVADGALTEERAMTMMGTFQARLRAALSGDAAMPWMTPADRMRDRGDDWGDDRMRDRGDRTEFSGLLDADAYLFEVVGSSRGAIGEIERDDGRLHLEFDPNEAFLLVTPAGGDAQNGTLTLTATGNAGADSDAAVTIVLDEVSRTATMTRGGNPVQLVATGAGAQRRITGVDVSGDGQSDLDLYAYDVFDEAWGDTDDD
jgi:hypothetical protein